MCQIPFHSASLQEHNVASTLVESKDQNLMSEEQLSLLLLECAASNDLERFKLYVEHKGAKLDSCATWYCREYGSNKMATFTRTPAMIAALYGSFHVLDYILKHGGFVNKVCGTDRNSVLHSAAASGADNVIEIVELLLRNGADPDLVDVHGLKPFDVKLKLSKGRTITREIFCGLSFPASISMSPECMLPDDISVDSFSETSLTEVEDSWSSQPSESPSPQFLIPDSGKDAFKQEQICGSSLSDIRNINYATDEFRIYAFKVRPCSKAYTHDWTECPFAHPGENAKRRDPRKYQYSCVPCPEFRKGTCKNGDACEYAHGVFETWLHPAQYRTRMCKDAGNCTRRVCFFAHSEEQLRSVPECIEALSPLASPSIDAPRLKSPSSPPPFSTKSMEPLSISPSIKSFNGSLTEAGLPSLHSPGGAQSTRLRASLFARDGLENEDLRCKLDCQSFSTLSSSNIGNSACMTGKNEFNFSSSPCLEDFPNGQSPKSPLQIYFSMGQECSTALPKTPLHPKLQIQAQLHQLQEQRRVTNNRMAQLQSNFIQQSVTQSSTIDLGSKIQRSSLTEADPYSSYSQFPHPYNSLHSTNKRCQSSKNLEGALAWSDWGSPTGKPEWGVSGDDLTKFRKSMSFKDKPLLPCIKF